MDKRIAEANLLKTNIIIDHTMGADKMVKTMQNKHNDEQDKNG